MNRLIILFTLLLLCGTPLYAQDRGVNFLKKNLKEGQRYESGGFEARINYFFTAELQLTPSETKAFIPIYKEYRRTVMGISRDCRKGTQALANQKKPARKDCLKVIDACLEADSRVAETTKEYYEQFKKVIPPEKLYLLREAERNFVDFIKSKPDSLFVHP